MLRLRSLGWLLWVGLSSKCGVTIEDMEYVDKIFFLKSYRRGWFDAGRWIRLSEREVRLDYWYVFHHVIPMCSPKILGWRG